MIKKEEEEEEEGEEEDGEEEEEDEEEEKEDGGVDMYCPASHLVQNVEPLTDISLALQFLQLVCPL